MGDVNVASRLQGAAALLTACLPSWQCMWRRVCKRAHAIVNQWLATILKQPQALDGYECQAHLTSGT